ncbi:hypothetical protein CLOP_g2386 [Closterium sp. NIES-67]|nr:hypothetical protein CLOP_g2386 [Closterium sp. NIES-67]
MAPFSTYFSAPHPLSPLSLVFLLSRFSPALSVSCPQMLRAAAPPEAPKLRANGRGPLPVLLEIPTFSSAQIPQPYLTGLAPRFVNAVYKYGNTTGLLHYK